MLECLCCSVVLLCIPLLWDCAATFVRRCQRQFVIIVASLLSSLNNNLSCSLLLFFDHSCDDHSCDFPITHCCPLATLITPVICMSHIIVIHHIPHCGFVVICCLDSNSQFISMSFFCTLFAVACAMIILRRGVTELLLLRTNLLSFHAKSLL